MRNVQVSKSREVERLKGAERLLSAAVPYLDRQTFHYQVAYFLPWKDAEGTYQVSAV